MLLIALYWITASLWLGIGGVLFAGGLQLLQQIRIPRRWQVLPIAVWWCTAEVLGSLIFSIITIGEGGIVTSAFSFGFTGFLLAQHEGLLQLARIAGVYGLSVLFGVVAYVLAQALRVRTVSGVSVLAGTLVVFVSGSIPVATWLPTGESDATYSVAVVDSWFPLDMLQADVTRTTIRTEYGEAVATALAAGADHVILPEDARFFDQSRPAGSQRALFDLRFERPSIILVDSGRVELDDGGAAVQAFVYDGINDIIDRVQKRYLVPQGEFMPTAYASTLRLFGYGAIVDQVAADVSYRVGPNTDQSGVSPAAPGILFCFESVDPRGVRQVVRERGDVPFIAHPISHAWFHDPHQLWWQLDTMLRVQAIWNQVPIVSAGSHVFGQIYLPTGERLVPKTIETNEFWTVRMVELPRV